MLAETFRERYHPFHRYVPLVLVVFPGQCHRLVFFFLLVAEHTLCTGFFRLDCGSDLSGLLAEVDGLYARISDSQPHNLS